MKINHKSIAMLALGASMLLSACGNDADYTPLRDQAYITTTATKANTKQEIIVADGEQSEVEFNVNLSDVTQKDAKYKITIDPTVLDNYNTRNSSNFKVLPSSQLSLSTTEVEVKAGSSSSSSIKMSIQALTKELIETGDDYAIPIRIISLDGAPDVVAGGGELVYTIKPVITSTVPVMGTYKGTYISGTVSDVKEEAMDKWTVEFLVNMSRFSINNQAIFGSWGKENSEIYIRFGDASTPYNTLQVKFGGTQFDQSNTVFVPNRWYHIAVVYDGTTLALYVDGNKDLDTDKVAGRTFYLGQSLSIVGSGATYFRAAAMLHELRVWKVARTPAQLRENAYSVSPKTPGLLHYWKMDKDTWTAAASGAGGILKNSVADAPDMTLRAAPQWMDNVRSDNKGRQQVD